MRYQKKSKNFLKQKYIDMSKKIDHEQKSAHSYPQAD